MILVYNKAITNTRQASLLFEKGGVSSYLTPQQPLGLLKRSIDVTSGNVCMSFKFFKGCYVYSAVEPCATADVISSSTTTYKTTNQDFVLSLPTTNNTSSSVGERVIANEFALALCHT